VTIRYPTLAILPVEKLLIHEHHDESRCLPLIQRIEASGIFTNPVIVTPLDDRTGRYLVLDGANRTTAMRLMAYPHVLTQVIHPDELGVSTQTWNHVCWGIEPESFFNGIWAVPGLTLKHSDVDRSFDDLINNRALVTIHLPDGSVYAAHAQTRNAKERNDYLNMIVGSYVERCSMDRTPIRTIAGLEDSYNDLSGLVLMPVMEISSITYLAGEGYMLPAGVTRFSISPRAMRVNYPLDRLADQYLRLQEKNDGLDRWLRDRFEAKGVRYYAESTVLYDE
jgi:hypothetical protein